MSAELNDITDEAGGAAGRARLTYWQLLWFSLPLSLTFLMMSGAAPLVSNGITWMHGAAGERVHLSAFLMTFATALFIYSPMFTSRNVAIRTITDRRSLAAFARFFVLWGSLCAVLLVLFSQVDSLGHLMFGRLLGASAETEHLARQGLLAFVPIPVLIALRGIGQGCHITNGQTWHVGIGTGLRLAGMAIFVFAVAIHTRMSGPVLGGLTYLTGIGLETLYVMVTLWRRPQWQLRSGQPTISFGTLTRYAGPLMLGAGLQQFTGPLLIYIINHARQPEENAAAYNLVRDTIWILVSTLMTIQPVVIHHGVSFRNLAIVTRFAIGWLLLVTGLGAAMAFTPLRELIFIGWFRLDNRVILDLLFTALIWLLPVPLVTMLNHYTNALHTRSGRTGWVTAGNIIGLAALWGAAMRLDLSRYDGVVLAVAGNAGFQLISAIVQTIGLRKGGLRASLTPELIIDRPRPS